MNINNVFSKDIAIDMGSCYTRIIVSGDGIALYEPTILAKDINTGEIIAAGKEAREMEGKCPPCIEIIKPICNGVISDFDNAVALLKAFLLRVCEKNIIKPRVVITVPCSVTEVERRAIIDVATFAGSRKTFIIEAPLAAATGANCDISLARGMLIAHIGGGICDISTISLGHTIVNNSIKSAGNQFTEATIKYIKNKYDLNIGRVTAENLKESIGCVYSLDTVQSRKVYGSDGATGTPRSVIISSEELKEAYEPILVPIISAIKTTLEDTPPELLGDILEDGILLTGGGAALYGIDRRIRMALGIKVFLAENLDLCSVMGAGLELAKLNNKNIGIKSAPSIPLNL